MSRPVGHSPLPPPAPTTPDMPTRHGPGAPATLERIDTGIVLTGLLVDHLRSRGVIDAKIEGRIVRR